MVQHTFVSSIDDINRVRSPQLPESEKDRTERRKGKRNEYQGKYVRPSATPSLYYPRHMKRQRYSFENHRVSKSRASKNARSQLYKTQKLERLSDRPHLNRWRTIVNPSSSTGARHPLLEIIDSCASGLVCSLTTTSISRATPCPLSTTTRPSTSTLGQHLLCGSGCGHPFTFFDGWDLRSFTHEWNGTHSTNDGHRKVCSRARI